VNLADRKFDPRMYLSGQHFIRAASYPAGIAEAVLRRSEAAVAAPGDRWSERQAFGEIGRLDHDHIARQRLEHPLRRAAEEYAL